MTRSPQRASPESLGVPPEAISSFVLTPTVATEEMAVGFIEAEDQSIMIDPLGAFLDGYDAMLSARPPIPEGLREAFAKIIDPDAFDPGGFPGRSAGAFRKADQILALIGGGKP